MLMFKSHGNRECLSQWVLTVLMSGFSMCGEAFRFWFLTGLILLCSVFKGGHFWGFTLWLYQGFESKVFSQSQVIRLCLQLLVKRFVFFTKHVYWCLNSVMMGPTELPSQSSETIKIPTAHYEFGANYYDPKVIFLVISCFHILMVMKKIWKWQSKYAVVAHRKGNDWW